MRYSNKNLVGLNNLSAALQTRMWKLQFEGDEVDIKIVFFSKNIFNDLNRRLGELF